MLQICERSDDLFIEIPTEIHSSNVSALLNSYITYIFLKKDSYFYAPSICFIIIFYKEQPNFGFWNPGLPEIIFLE